MKVLVLTRLELRLAWNGFRLRMKSRQNRLLYGLIAAACVGMNFILNSFLNFPLREDRFQALLSIDLEGFSSYLVISAGLTVPLAYSVVKGLWSKLSTLEFRGPDLPILKPAPLRPYEVFISKSLKVFVKRLFFTFIAEATFLTPFMVFLRMAPERVVALLSVILLYACSLYILEAFMFLASRLTVKLLRTRGGITLTIIPLGGLITLLPEWFPSGAGLTALLPSTAVSKVVYFTLFRKAPMMLITFPMLSSLSLSLGLFATVVILSELYYVRVENFEESLRSAWPRSLRNRVRWNIGSRRGPLTAIFLKELWVNVRVSFIPLIAVDYLILLLIWVLKLDWVAFGLSAPITVSSSVLALSMLLFIFFEPSLDVFLTEREKSWIIKVAPISMERLVLAKYLYSLVHSLIALLPLLIGIASLAPYLIERIILSISSISMLIMTNALGVYIAAHYTPPSLREDFPVTGVCAYIGLIAILTSPIILIPLLFASRPNTLVFTMTMMFDYAVVLSYVIIRKAAKHFANRDDL